MKNCAIVVYTKSGAVVIYRKVEGTRYEAPWLFEPTKRPDDRADYCLDCNFLSATGLQIPQCKHRVRVFTVECTGVRPMGEQW